MYLQNLIQFQLKEFLNKTWITRQAFYKSMRHVVRRVSRWMYEIEEGTYNQYKKYYASKKRIKQGVSR